MSYVDLLSSMMYLITTKVKQMCYYKLITFFLLGRKVTRYMFIEVNNPSTMYNRDQ
jgi:hypothetical protein